MSNIRGTGGDKVHMHPTFTGCTYVDLTPPAQIWVDWRTIMQTVINHQFPLKKRRTYCPYERI